MSINKLKYKLGEQVVIKSSALQYIFCLGMHIQLLNLTTSAKPLMQLISGCGTSKGIMYGTIVSMEAFNLYTICKTYYYIIFVVIAEVFCTSVAKLKTSSPFPTYQHIISLHEACLQVGGQNLIAGNILTPSNPGELRVN